MKSPEQWLPVVGFAGKYEVSDHGRVRSLERVVMYQNRYSGHLLTVQKRIKGRVLRPGPQQSGHLSVALGTGHARAPSFQVHALVLEAFVGPRPASGEARHLDDNPRNNCLANLCWGTRSENLHDAVRNGKKPVGDDVWNAKLRAVDIPTIRSLIRNGVTYAAISRRYHVNEATIRQVRDGRTWKSA